MAAIPYPNNLPSRWGANKTATIAGWWNGPSGEVMRRMIAQVFPGLPAEAHMGFVANGGWTEDTALARSHAAFHELGGYGITGGPWDVPAPNTDTSKENDWYALHADPEVRALLGGRDATMTPFPRTASGRGLQIPLDDQIAIGLVSLKRKRDAVNRSLDERIRWRDPVGLWATAMSFMAWSAGPGTTARHINQFADVLAGVPEADRWDAYLRAVAQGVQAGTVSRGSSHAFTVYSTVRTQQKIRASRALAERLGRPTAFYGTPDPAVEDVIARAAGGSGGTSDLAGPDESEHALAAGWSATEIALGVVVAASVVAGAYIVYKRATRRRPNGRRH